jgi:hypothetical protein
MELIVMFGLVLDILTSVGKEVKKDYLYTQLT